MIQIYEKRGRWCYRDDQGKLFRFNTEAEAKSSLGLEIKSNGSEEKKEKSSKKETNTNKQKTVLDSKSSD